MAERTAGDITIDASPEEVLDVITDFDAYPKWAKGIKRCKVLKRDSRGRPMEVSMEAGQMGFNASYTLRYRYKTRAGGLSWTTVEASGAVKDINGEYTLEPTDGGTHVMYSMTIELAVPVPGMVKRQAERTIIGTALNGLKRRVERG